METASRSFLEILINRQPITRSLLFYFPLLFYLVYNFLNQNSNLALHLCEPECGRPEGYLCTSYSDALNICIGTLVPKLRCIMMNSRGWRRVHLLSWLVRHREINSLFV